MNYVANPKLNLVFRRCIESILSRKTNINCINESSQLKKIPVIQNIGN
jgi:hypothetical protein